MSSAVKAARHLLANNAPLVAQVAATKIQAGVLAQATELPAIVLTHVSTIRKHMLRKGATEYCTSRVQVTVIAKTYPQLMSILALVRAALPRTRATVAGVQVDGILLEAEGPDFRDDEIGTFMGSLDYIITFNE